MKKIFLTTLILLTTLTAFADEVTFVTSAPKAVELNKAFRLKYTVNRRNVKEPRIPQIGDFAILSGPSRSEQSSTQIINGNVTSTQSVTFTYVLMPQKEGEFTIPGATISVDGSEITSNKVTVKVLPEDKTAAAQQRNSQRRGGKEHIAATELCDNCAHYNAPSATLCRVGAPPPVSGSL